MNETEAAIVLNMPHQVELTGDDLLFFDVIRDNSSPMDAIILKSGLPVATVSSRLLALEHGLHLCSLPGNQFFKLI